MLSGKTVTALLLSITAVGLFAVTGYNLRHGAGFTGIGGGL